MPLHTVLERYETGGSLPRPPLASLGHGGAGVAYVLLRQAALTGDGRWLTQAREWVGAAERSLAAPGAFTGDSPVFPDERATIPASLYFGEAGVWCCEALVAAAQDDGAGRERCVRRYSALAGACPPDRSDTVSGAAGLLLGAAAMVEATHPSTDEHLVAAGEGLAHRLARLAGAGALLPPASLGWLGAAHGWAGIAHSLLRWSQATGTPPGPEVARLLAALTQLRLETGLWPRHTAADEVWSGWCHGSAGWAQLWTLAWEVLGDAEALVLADIAASDAVAIADAGPGLCCGEAGAAYAAVAVYRATGDGAWLDHARTLAARAARAVPGPSFPEHSLWQGDLGVALLLAELDQPATAAMPLYRRN